MKTLRVFFAMVVSLMVAQTASSVTLTLWETERDVVQKAVDKIIQRFQKENPSIKIKRSHYKLEDVRTQFQTAAMGGSGASIVIAPNDFGGPFSIMGIIKNVESWVQPARFDDYVVKAVSDEKNRMWGVPVTKGNHLMLLINGNMVKEAPKTIDELIATAKKFTDPSKGNYGFAYNLTEPFWLVPFMTAYGQQPLVDKQPKLDSKAMQQALTLVKKLKFDDKIVPQDCDYSCADTLFVESKVPMIINGDWAVEKYKKKFGDKLIVAALPSLTAKGGHLSPLVSGKYLFLNANLKRKKLDAAKKFAEFMVSPEIQEFLVKETGVLPALKTVAESPVVKANKYLKASNDAMVNGMPMPMDVELRVVWDAIRPQLQNVMAGRVEVKKAVASMQQDALRKIKEMKQ